LVWNTGSTSFSNVTFAAVGVCATACRPIPITLSVHGSLGWQAVPPDGTLADHASPSMNKGRRGGPGCRSQSMTGLTSPLWPGLQTRPQRIDVSRAGYPGAEYLCDPCFYHARAGRRVQEENRK